MCFDFFFFFFRSCIFERFFNRELDPKNKRADTSECAERRNKIVIIEPHTQTTRCRPLRFSETVSYLDLIFVAFVFATREKDDRSRRDAHLLPPPTGDLRAQKGLEGLFWGREIDEIRAERHRDDAK
jgi:hypothetical protein